jgi:hypothetical protein
VYHYRISYLLCQSPVPTSKNQGCVDYVNSDSLFDIFCCLPYSIVKVCGALKLGPKLGWVSWFSGLNFFHLLLIFI